MDTYINLLNKKDYESFQNELQKMDPHQIAEVYQAIRIDPKLRLQWEIYDIFLEYNYDTSIVHEQIKTFFEDCKPALIRSTLKGTIFITQFLCKLLKQAYLMSDDQLSDSDGNAMLEMAVKYTRPVDLQEILRLYPKTLDPKLLYLAIDNNPTMVVLLLEGDPSINFINDSISLVNDRILKCLR